MYLVLTALLALNVSNEILNAFKVLAKGIQDSNITINDKTKAVYDVIKTNAADPTQKDKVMPYKLRADEIVAKSDSMITYLEDWQRKVITEAGGYTKGDNNDSEISRPDNIDATTDLLVEKKGGDDIKKRILALRKFMLESVPQDSAIVRPQMPLNVTAPPKSDHNPTRDWSIGYFEHMPTVAAIAMFAKFENDVRSSEALVVNTLFNEAHTKDIKFDTTAAIAVPTTSYAIVGQKIEANILLAAFNKHNSPTVTVLSGGGSTKPAVNGVVPWETNASGTGMQTVKGRITLSEEGNPIVKDWTFQYMVGSTGGSMQLDKMNVFYIGVDNPVTIAAAGYSIEDVSLEIPGAIVKPDDAAGKGHYLINVDKVGDVMASIVANTKEAGKKTVNTPLKIRVKKIPNPIASLGGKFGGVFPINQFKIQIAPAAILEGFDFEAKFLVTGFTYSTQPRSGDYRGPVTVHTSGGARFTDKPEIKKFMDQAKVGDKIFIEDIHVVGPDKKERVLPGSLLFTLIP